MPKRLRRMGEGKREVGGNGGGMEVFCAHQSVQRIHRDSLYPADTFRYSGEKTATYTAVHEPLLVVVMICFLFHNEHVAIVFDRP